MGYQWLWLNMQIHLWSVSWNYSILLTFLFQKVTYNTKKPTYDLRTVAEVEGPGVKGGNKTVWKEQIIVPTLHQSSLTDGNLIHICYYIQVSFCYAYYVNTM